MSDDDTARTLVLMRHSEAGMSITGSDHERSLTHQGLADARAAGTWLRDAVGAFDLVVCSSARRTRQTWEQAQLGGATAAELDLSDAVYDAGLHDLIDVVAALPDDARRVLMLGHAPGIPALGHLLAVPTQDAAYEQVTRGCPTSGIITLAVPTPWSQVAAQSCGLVSFVAPRA